MTGPDPVLVVGTVAYDTIETPFEKAERVLGGSACYFATASSLFTPTQLVSIVGGDFEMAALDPLRERKVDLSGLEVREDEATFHWSGEYHYDMNTRTTKATDLNVLTSFDPVVPEGARDAPLVFLANIDPELQLDVLDQVNDPRLVAMDTMNFWIEGKADALHEVLQRVDILIINDEEARELADTPSLTQAMRDIQKMGPNAVVVKKGEHGCMLANGTHWFSAPAYLHADLHDPTGAGDAFAGGFMGTLASLEQTTDKALRKATVYGTACASLVIEAFGPHALSRASREDVEA
ncbi:MAG: PfkB family carbohydrate kinase, partial [Candidatus Thermoplasmatota archaeon]|nr:PfkB family carbohydrate kinase [Candidatus Thermoplasmatota archaeon]